MKKNIWVLISLFALGACSITRETPAPIINGTAPKAAVANQSPAYIKPTTAVSSSAATTAAAGTTIHPVNNDNDTISTSDVPPTNKPAVATKKKIASAPIATSAAATTAVVSNLGGVKWLKPTQGKIIQAYSATTKGVDVSGVEGQAVVAADSGTVAYSGNGLKGYGNLIIIKHANNYLTAYSHNKINLVKEGATVKRGQKIAELGKTESDRPLLHFELRKSGKPIDPTSIFN